MAEEKNTKRVQLELPEKAYNRLTALKDKTEAASYAAVIASALKLYEALVDDAEKGGELFLKTADGGEVKIKPIF